MINIVILGAGNVASHLYKAIASTSNYRIVQVYNRSAEALDFFSENTAVTIKISEIVDADIYILALKDDVITEVASRLHANKALIVHTSGATSIEALKKFERSGVFYPLQTFTKGKEVNFKNIPLCVEASQKTDLEILKQLALAISENVYELSSPQRKSLHVAAVFVSNFVNYLYSEGESICKENNIPFEILHPLILETASKATNISPIQAQTGPAIRKDNKIINAHIEQLNHKQEEVYKLITQSIQNLHGKEL